MTDLTTTEITERITTGQAVLRYIISDEAWYHRSATESRHPSVILDISVGIDAPDGGTYGEWTIDLYDFDRTTSYRHNYAAQHRVFGDACVAICAVPGYWSAMAGIETPEGIIATLKGLGFTDKTERTPPPGVRVPVTEAERTREAVASALEDIANMEVAWATGTMTADRVRAVAAEVRAGREG